ncbi:putative formin-like protein 5 [Iris pallida]|uniref:Formin-like protein 5 n=1 Tax=Iris pallida TaxID=29817 RepID=A0AAX6FRU5_IRIPA|nr:putative formin-like protein 5 [Iris pallida]
MQSRSPPPSHGLSPDHPATPPPWSAVDHSPPTSSSISSPFLLLHPITTAITTYSSPPTTVGLLLQHPRTSAPNCRTSPPRASSRHRRRHRRRGRRGRPPMPGAPYAAFPWRPTSSGTRRRGNFCVLNEIPSTRASFELRIGAPSQQLRARFPGDPTVGSAISSLRRNLVSWGQLRQLVSPPPQLCLACYQFRCEAGLCGFSGTSYTCQLFRLSRRIAWRCLLA